MNTDRPGRGLRAAVIGASGIGKHHAKWYHLAGCDVVAFCGTSRASTAATSEALQQLFGFRGNAYCDIAEMLEAERPDVVSVCTPPELHDLHALASLRADAHVMCEKPLFLAVTGIGAVLAQGRYIVEAAQSAGRVLAVNTQYAAAAEAYRDRLGLGADRIESFYMRMESRGRKEGRGYRDIWVDLASHPISVLMALVPDGEPDYGSVRCTVRQNEVAAELDVLSPTTGLCRAVLETANTPPDQPVIRRFGINGALVDYEGRRDENGVFCAYLSDGGREVKTTDFVQTSLTRFIAGAAGDNVQPLASGEQGLRNLEIQLRLLERAERA